MKKMFLWSLTALILFAGFGCSKDKDSNAPSLVGTTWSCNPETGWTEEFKFTTDSEVVYSVVMLLEDYSDTETLTYEYTPPYLTIMGTENGVPQSVTVKVDGNKFSIDHGEGDVFTYVKKK